MSSYKTLIFDLDDTLINNNESIKYAFKYLVNKLNMKYTNEFFEEWRKFDIAYWRLWESGNMPVPNTIKSLKDKITYLRANRFILFFKNLKLSIYDAISINELYCSMLGVNIVEIEGAKELLTKLSNHYEILIATNGPKNAAISKVDKINVSSYVSYIISSEEVGYSKPMPEFFDYLYNKIDNNNKDEMLLIGDSLTTDILGGMENGIDTCWFNPNNKELQSEYKPTMTINKLLELKKKL